MQHTRLPVARVDRLRRRFGANYLPSWSDSSSAQWLQPLPTKTLQRELGLARALGLDHLRVWLSALAWEADPDGYTASVGQLADAFEAAGLDLVVQLFDSCGLDTTGTPPESRRIGDLRLLAAGDDRYEFMVHWTDEPGRDFFDAPALVPIQWRGNPMVALWQGWQPSPGYTRISAAEYPLWERYVGQILERIGGHPSLLLVEIMNEPYMTHLLRPVDRELIDAFVAFGHGAAMRAAPDVPLSIGAASPSELAHHESTLSVPLDVVSFHSYAGGDELADEIRQAVDFAGDRPSYLSEWGYFPGGDDAHSLLGYGQRLPTIAASGVSWAAFHLIAGYGPFALSALLYPSGVMRPSAELIRTALSTETVGI